MRINTTTRSLTPVLLAAFTAVALLGCNEIADAIDENKDALDVPVSASHSFPAKFDVGKATGQTAGQKAPAEVTHDLSVPAQDLDLIAQVPELKNAEGRVKSFEITKLAATPKTNTVTGALPSFDLYIGALGNKDLTKAVKVATIPSIPGKSTAVIAATLPAAGMKAAQEHFTKLRFSQSMVAKLVVKKGEEVPDGAADLSITMGLKIVLNPIK